MGGPCGAHCPDLRKSGFFAYGLRMRQPMTVLPGGSFATFAESGGNQL
jgi:hypothetical protein